MRRGQYGPIVMSWSRGGIVLVPWRDYETMNEASSNCSKVKLRGPTVDVVYHREQADCRELRCVRPETTVHEY